MSQRILVIADDLTGAAEIAGIATRFGLRTALLCRPVPPPAGANCVIYDTDSRLLSKADAVAKVRTFADAARTAPFDLIFKKTDSVLRGEPAAEIKTVASAFGRRRVIWVPQNPSRGRIIRGGIYFVGGNVLSETQFAFDPVHPANSPYVADLLRDDEFQLANPTATGDVGDYLLGEGESVEDVDHWAHRLVADQHTGAGGADFFEAVCRKLLAVDPKPTAELEPSTALATLAHPLLIVRGTTSNWSRDLREDFADARRLLPMPDDVFREGHACPTIVQWVAATVAVLERDGEAMIEIDQLTDRAPGRAQAVAAAMAEATKRLLASTRIGTVAVEGGATAAAVVDSVGWTAFDVEGEFTPGIVLLRPAGTDLRFVVKPGSYPWPTPERPTL